ncbi:MAG TPA: UDP-N-acetylmuramoyl-L-alanine--D-glutamate ligase [Candidatus Woesebacteria bacterium]|nr:UDP-N-acetylmuramoyl-L-alanine--D-glutamate ligase [Candidatus Woesebacteria bacterium]
MRDRLDLDTLRSKHQRLIYEGFVLAKDERDLLLTFNLTLEPDIHFQPKLKIKNLSPEILQQIPTQENLDPQLDRLFFHLGLAEIPSYFKAACPAEIVIKHQGQITKKSISFWHNLLISGLGEFYYQNKIDFTSADFVQIKLEKTHAKKTNLTKVTFKQSQSAAQKEKSSILIPVGGGKDSATVLAMIEERKLPYDIFLLAPHAPSAKKIALLLQKEGHCQKIIEAERIIDPQLFELNKKGYLNGHTPFSAYLAFVSVTIAYLYGQENILLGNERSSEEENLVYLGHKINHQYSKSLDFEQKFAAYSQTQLFLPTLTNASKHSPHYLSLLRPFSELEITQKLCAFANKDSRFARILTIFKSCNVGQKEDRFCHQCPKCAFVFTMFSAFLDEQFVSEKIFSENLFAKKSLEQTFLDLAGFGDKKPFECVGTFAEMRQALLLAYEKSKAPTPFLKTINRKIAQQNLMDKLRDQSICILGMGREGLSTLQFLRQNFPHKKIAVADQSTTCSRNLPKDDNLEQFFGPNYLQKISQYQIIIKTAGIPVTTAEVQKAIAHGSEIFSNTQIFFTLFNGTIIGVTGTKGKSTTSKLTYEILTAFLNNPTSQNATYQKTVLVGNIGEAPLNQLAKINEHTLVVDELSSHQLAELKTSPHVAIVLDIKSEHLDYYGNFAKYFTAKTAIARYQKTNDYFIYDPDLVGSSQMAKLSSAQKLPYSFDQKNNALVYRKNGQIFYQDEAIIPIKEIPLLGEHNLYNVMPAILVGKLFGVNSDLIRKTIKNFKSLPHRLELVAEINGVMYFDDSISTNPHAAIMAIKSFTKNSVILIAGGYDRNQDFTELAKTIVDYQVKHLITLPTTGQRLAAAVLKEKPISVSMATTMEEAVQIAQQVAKKTNVVLLSPASASFSGFTNYEERGEAFKKAVKKIANDQKRTNERTKKVSIESS